MTVLQHQKLRVDLNLLFDYDRIMNFEFDGSRDFVRIRMDLFVKYVRPAKPRPRIATRTSRTAISEMNVRSDLTANNTTQKFFGWVLMSCRLSSPWHIYVVVLEIQFLPFLWIENLSSSINKYLLNHTTILSNVNFSKYEHFQMSMIIMFKNVPQMAKRYLIIE